MGLQEALIEQAIKKIDFEKLGLQLIAKFKPAELVAALAKSIGEHAEEAKEELNKDYDGDGVSNADELKRCAEQMQECAGILAKVYGEVADDHK